MFFSGTSRGPYGIRISHLQTWPVYCTFQVNLCSLFSLELPKEALRPKWTIYEHETDTTKKFRSVGNLLILSAVVVICSAFTAYVTLFKGLKYLLKRPYFIRNYSKVARSLFRFSAGRKHYPMSEKNISKMKDTCVW